MKIKTLGSTLLCALILTTTGCSKYNEHSEIVADVMKTVLTKYKDPDSVVLTSMSDFYIDMNVIKVNTTAKNSFGANVSNNYYLILNDFSCDRELFDKMFGDKKNEPYDGSYFNYSTWYEFYEHYYFSYDGVYAYKTGHTFDYWSFYAGTMFEVGGGTIGEFIISDIISEYKDFTVNEGTTAEVNEILNEYKIEQGWRSK